MKRPHLLNWASALLIAVGMLAGLLPAQPASAVTTGSIRILTFKGDTAERVTGACFQLVRPGSVINACDTDRQWESGGKDGQTFSRNIFTGTWTVRQTMVPAGYRRAAAVSVTIEDGRQATVTIRQRSGGNTLNLRTVDGSGNLVMGACYDVSRPAEASFLLCDASDGLNDGRVATGGLRIASYTVTQTQTPAGYFRDDSAKTVTYSSSGVTRTVDWAIVKAPASARITVTVRNSGGALVSGACLTLEQPAGVTRGFACDGGGSIPIDGKVTFTAIAPGTYRLVLFNAASLGSYVNPAPMTVTKVGGTALNVTITLPSA